MEVKGLKLDKFTLGYIEAAFFCDSEKELGDKGIHDINLESLKEIKKECEDFQEENSDLLQHEDNFLDLTQQGRDFWFTRNRHGVGYWDRGLGKIGKELTERAHVYGDAYFMMGDNGEIYHH